MNIKWAVIIFLIMFMAGLFDAVNTGEELGLGGTAGEIDCDNIQGAQDRVNCLLENEPFTTSNVVGPDIGVEVPMFGSSTLRIISNSLTWNHSFFTGEWAMMRWPFLLISWIGIIWQLGFATILIQIMQLILQAGQLVMGAAGGIVRSFLRI